MNEVSLKMDRQFRCSDVAHLPRRRQPYIAGTGMLAVDLGVMLRCNHSKHFSAIIFIADNARCSFANSLKRLQFASTPAFFYRVPFGDFGFEISFPPTRSYLVHRDQVRTQTDQALLDHRVLQGGLQRSGDVAGHRLGRSLGAYIRRQPFNLKYFTPCSSGVKHVGHRRQAFGNGHAEYLDMRSLDHEHGLGVLVAQQVCLAPEKGSGKNHPMDTMHQINHRSTASMRSQLCF